MDEIVEKIAREVMLKLKSEAGNRGSVYTPPQNNYVAPKTAGKYPLVLITANFKVIDQVMGNIRGLIPGSAKVVVSEYLHSHLDSYGRGSGIDIISPKNASARDLIKDAQELIVPSLSINTLSKAANLVADSFATQLISYALIDGVPLTITDESLLDAGRYFPTGVAKKVDQFRRELESMGARFQRSSALIKPEHKCSTCVGGGTCAGCQGEAPIERTVQIASPMPATGGNSSCLQDNCSRSYGSCPSSCEQSVRKVITAGADRVEKGHDSLVPARDLARFIDHTLLKATATPTEVTKLCDEAKQHIFASVCINPGNVALAARLLKGTLVKVCTVVGFPLGATSTFTKVVETRDAIANGATEIDMVINVGALKARDYEMVKNDIARVVEAAQGNTVKVILETSLLNKEEKVKGCELSKLAGADFVKTSTGFSSGGATAEDIALMRATVGPTMGVKASGGVRDTAGAQEMIAAGATRIGASASVGIVKGETAAAGKGY
jgi:deoxyribose-phosphate aldolase